MPINCWQSCFTSQTVMIMIARTSPQLTSRGSTQFRVAHNHACAGYTLTGFVSRSPRGKLWGVCVTTEQRTGTEPRCANIENNSWTALTGVESRGAQGLVFGNGNVLWQIVLFTMLHFSYFIFMADWTEVKLCFFLVSQTSYGEWYKLKFYSGFNMFM